MDQIKDYIWQSLGKTQAVKDQQIKTYSMDQIKDYIWQTLGKTQIVKDQQI